MLESLCSGFGEAVKVRALCERGKLIPGGEHKAIGLFNMSEAVNQHSFFGRCIGFHVRKTQSKIENKIQSPSARGGPEKNI